MLKCICSMYLVPILISELCEAAQLGTTTWVRAWAVVIYLLITANGLRATEVFYILVGLGIPRGRPVGDAQSSEI